MMAHGDDPILLDKFSNTLLEVYRLAREEPLERFLQTMLECIQPLIPFSAAWWGNGAPSADNPELMHSYYLYNLPDSYFEDWRSIKDHDNTIEQVSHKSGSAVVLTIDSPEISNGLKWLAQKYNFSELMCIIISQDEVSGLIDHLSLYRSTDDIPFSALEINLLEALMPHLLSAKSINHLRNAQVLQESRKGVPQALAICDAKGVLKISEPGFADLLLNEWPDWKGPILPFMPTQDGYQGQMLSIEAFPRDEKFLLVARTLYPIEQLSTREQDVAVRFGQGETYKEIARDIGISPNTVRYYLRSIYIKLGINNKTEISRLLHDLRNNKPI